MQGQRKSGGGFPFWDKVLLKRVKEYVHHHPRKYLDPDTIALDLQGLYGEYNRRKRAAFRKQVKRAYESIKESDDKKRKPDSLNDLEAKHLAKRGRYRGTEFCDDSDSFSDDAEYVDMPDRNAVNKQLDNLYNQRKSPIVTPTPSNPGTPTCQTPARSDADSDVEDVDFGILEMDFANDRDVLEPKKTPKKSDSKMKKKSKDASSNFPTPGRKKAKVVVEAQKSSVLFSDIGGNDLTLQEVCKLLVHLRHPEVYEQLGVTPPRGVLLHGPPGCGKTLLANAIAGELELPFLKIAATEIVSGVSGESEGNIRDIFQQAQALAPCILFLDEIDAITPKRETAQREMERRIVAQLLSCMDDLSKTECHVLVIGATNRVDALDPALRRAGRFDREIAIGIPDEKARQRILKVLCKNLRLAEEFDYPYLASMTPGYVGADLMALCREAALCAVNRIFDQLQKANEPSHDHEADVSKESQGPPSDQVISEPKVESTSEITQPQSYHKVLSWLKEHPPLTEHQLSTLRIEIEDFKEALPLVQPSAKREGFATIPDVTWDDVGALHQIREELTMAILAPVRNPEAFSALGLSSPPGILLAGPPGCGKTLLAKAIANESGINFISVKGPELMNMYVGESERAVRQCFQRARNSAPCVIFFDELDALCPRRNDSSESGSTSRVVNQLLTEMDGLESRKQVFIMGATNRPDIIDPAVLRPGRMDKILYVGIPSPKDRVDIIKTITKNGTKPLVSEDVELNELGEDSRCDGFTGADLASLVREASMSALQKVIGTKHSIRGAGEVSEDIPTAIRVAKEDFEKAFRKVKPSVSKKDRLMYTKMKMRVLRGQDDEEQEKGEDIPMQT